MKTDFAVSGFNARSKIQVNLDTWAGPFDLLLYLIKKNDPNMNIYDIRIAEITGQFLEYLGLAVSADLDHLTEFYALASELIYIKSYMLLPKPELSDDDEEDPREELIERLIEYQRFKKLSDIMEEKLDLEEWSFERKKAQKSLPFEDDNLWVPVDTWALLQQMQQVFTQLAARYSSEKILDLFEEISINEKLTLMSELLENKGEFFFTELITRKDSIMDVVCAFMAVLEAVKSKTVSVLQNRMFGDIKIFMYNAVFPAQTAVSAEAE
ncbi:MAG: segregation/condensation protein A [Treponemataceae bacterium]|nr:MAG: segregation/condensation protein A [Treponemataceae bacterium]